jgi:hypothetical protein
MIIFGQNKSFLQAIKMKFFALDFIDDFWMNSNIVKISKLLLLRDFRITTQAKVKYLEILFLASSFEALLYIFNDKKPIK